MSESRIIAVEIEADDAERADRAVGMLRRYVEGIGFQNFLTGQKSSVTDVAVWENKSLDPMRSSFEEVS